MIGHPLVAHAEPAALDPVPLTGYGTALVARPVGAHDTGMRIIGWSQPPTHLPLRQQVNEQVPYIFHGVAVDATSRLVQATP